MDSRNPVSLFSVFYKYIGGRLFVILSLVMVSSLVEGLGITMALPLLDTLREESTRPDAGRSVQMLYDLLGWMGIRDSSIGILLFIAGLFVFKGVLSFASKGYAKVLQAHLLRELKEDLFSAYARMDYQYFLRFNTGHFINVINTQIGGFLRAFQFFSQFASQIVAAACYIALTIILSWKFAVLVVLVGALLYVPLQRLNEYVRRISQKTSREWGTLNTLLVQALQAFKYLISTAKVHPMESYVSASVRRLTGYEMRKGLAEAFTGSIREPIAVLVVVGVVAVQMMLFQEPLAPILVAILLFNRAFTSLMQVQSNWQHTLSLAGSIEMVDAEFQAATRNEESDGQREMGPFSGEIRLENASLSYDGESEAIRNLDVTIPARTTVAFVGRSGAGKSTLIDILTLLLRLDSGSLTIDGVPAEKIDLYSWRSQIGYVSQETVIFDDTVENNISLWEGDEAEGDDRSDVRRRVEEASRRAFAHSFIQELPDQYETSVGEGGIRLSGGQRQRLFIARELYKRPNLLLLDEATSALDTESERYVQQSIDALKGEVTTVIVAHRLSTIKNVDYVYVLDNGEVVEEGTYEELRARDDSQLGEMIAMQQL